MHNLTDTERTIIKNARTEWFEQGQAGERHRILHEMMRMTAILHEGKQYVSLDTILEIITGRKVNA